jgi:hypothetical protein
MTDRNSSLRKCAYLILVLSATVQFLAIAYYWWGFDSRLSCDWATSWSEWLKCLHDQSHTYIVMIEVAVAVWLVATLANLLGRFSPVYFSIFLPAIVAIGVVWLMIGLLQQKANAYNAYGEPTFEDILAFMRTTGFLAIYVVGPTTGGWLLGLYRRVARRAV